jgi:polyisoprenyl-phosphate glycosyltransferase
VIRQLAQRMPAVRGLRLSRNFGQHAAITAGVAGSTGSHVVVMDCDLQDPPELIAELYERARDGVDVVFARRSQRRQTVLRRVANSLYFRFLNRFGDTLHYGSHGTFSMVSRKVADAFLRLRQIDRDYLYALRWLGFTSAEVDYEQAERTFGESSYTFAGLRRQAVAGLLFHTTAFLRWIIYLGFSLAVIGLVAALVVLHRYFFLDVEPGWRRKYRCGRGGRTLCRRIFEQVRDRPLYVVNEEAGGEVSAVEIAVEAIAARRSA